MNCLLAAPACSLESGKNALPMGMPFIAAAMRRVEGLNLNFCNLNIDSGTLEEQRSRLISILERERIEAVFSGGLYFNYKSIRFIFETAKAFNPKVITVTGGPLLTGDPEIAMEVLQWADYGIIGEGERTVAELCRALMNGSSPTDIRGLIIKDGGGLKRTGAREAIEDWSREIPWPDYESFGFSSLIKRRLPAIYADAKTVTIHSSRGCPFKCTFCRNTLGSRYRQRPLDDFLAELRHLITTYPDLEIQLADDLLAESKPRLKAVCDGMRQNGLRGWTTQLRVTQVNEEIIQILLDGGCRRVTLGLESASDFVLKSMKKNIRFAQSEKALKLMLNSGILAYGLFIFGDAAETWETAMETIQWWEAHPEYAIDLATIVVLPGTELYQGAVASGRLDPKQHLRDGLPCVNVSSMSDDQYDQLLRVIAEKQAARQFRSDSDNFRLLDMRMDLDYQNMGKSVSGVCAHCGAAVKEEMGLFSELSCPNCRRPIILPFIDNLVDQAQIKANIIKLLGDGRGLAFWGIGWTFKVHISEETAGLPGIYLFDRNHGRQYGDKPVNPVDMIGKLGLDRVVIAASPLRQVYEDMVEEARGIRGVTEVISIYQLRSGDN